MKLDAKLPFQPNEDFVMGESDRAVQESLLSIKSPG